MRGVRSSACSRRRRRRCTELVLALFAITLGSLLVAGLSRGERNRERGGALVAAAAAADSTPADTGLSSYLSSARQLFGSSLEARDQTRAYSGPPMAKQDARTVQMLRDSIEKTSDLISDYQHDGLANMPQLPNVPGLNTIMRLPDKLLRAELSMLQDGIRMAEEMRERPIMATVNTPRGANENTMVQDNTSMENELDHCSGREQSSTSPGSFDCGCGKTYLWESCLVRHRNEKHSQSVRKTFVCCHCEKGFLRRYQLKSHERVCPPKAGQCANDETFDNELQGCDLDLST